MHFLTIILGPRCNILKKRCIRFDSETIKEVVTRWESPHFAYQEFLCVLTSKFSEVKFFTSYNCFILTEET